MTDSWDYDALAVKALAGECLSTEEAMSVLNAPDGDILALLNAAYTVRKARFGVGMRLNLLINAKSGHCSQDCGYCAQSAASHAKIDAYDFMDKEALLAGARDAEQAGAGTYCIVTSGLTPSDAELERVTEVVREIRATMSLTICVSLGILNEDQAGRLKAAGVDRYNHNINTSESHHPKIVTTHSYADRVRTVKNAQQAGMDVCCGVLLGVGETREQVVEMAFALRELGPDALPINFLHPVAGTRMEKLNELTPLYCLKTLVLFRLICPDKEIRVAGGREVNLRSLQPLALYAANSIFVGGYLTTGGQEPSSDHRMIKDLGFVVEQVRP